MAGGDVIRDVAEYLIVAFVVFALILEVTLHKLEHWIMARHPHVQTILRNLYRELMILGLVSFGFIMYLFTNNPSKDVKMTFEVAHVFVFLFAIFHTLVVALAVYISLNLSARWKKFERMDLIKYLELKEKYRKLTNRRTEQRSLLWRHLGWWITSPSKLFTYNKLHEIVAFHDIRWQFIYYRNLQPEFRFSKFLRKIKMATFIELVEIHPLNWFFLIVIILLDVLRLRIGSNPNFDAYLFISHSVFTMFVVTVLANKIHSIYWKMTKNPATYYDTVDPHAFRTELDIAEEEARIRRETAVNLSHDLSEDDVLSRPNFINTRKSLHGSSSSSLEGRTTHHNLIYHNMALKPGEHRQGYGNGHGRDSRDHPHSLNLNKALDKVLAPPPAAQSELYDPSTEMKLVIGSKVATSLLAQAKKQHEEASGGNRMSLEVKVVMPKSELDLRANPKSSLEFSDKATEQDKLQHMTVEQRNLRMEAQRRLRERRRFNAAIVQTAQDLQEAKNLSPSRKYPAWLVKLLPRLGRVPSAAEKLFWFGSHRFFLFCMEASLFFSSFTLAASVAKLIFWHKEMSEYEKQKKAAAISRVLVDNVVRAVKEMKNKKKQEPPSETLALRIVAPVIAFFALAYVLLNVARIMRKYVFVLNNANLLNEDMTVTTIQTVNLKDMMNAETMHEVTNQSLIVYDSEIETEGGENAANYSRMRQKMFTFLDGEQAQYLEGNDNSFPFLSRASPAGNSNV